MLLLYSFYSWKELRLQRQCVVGPGFLLRQLPSRVSTLNLYNTTLPFDTHTSWQVRLGPQSWVNFVGLLWQMDLKWNCNHYWERHQGILRQHPVNQVVTVSTLFPICSIVISHQAVPTKLNLIEASFGFRVLSTWPSLYQHPETKHFWRHSDPHCPLH